MRTVEWHEALLLIEREPSVVVVLVSDHPPSKVLTRRVAAYSKLYSARGVQTVCVPVTEDCACHPELAAVYLPQIRLFTDGELSSKLVGVQDEDTLSTLVI